MNYALSCLVSEIQPTALQMGGKNHIFKYLENLSTYLDFRFLVLVFELTILL